MIRHAAGASGAVVLLGLAAAGLALSGAGRPPDASFVVTGDRPVPAVTGSELVDARLVAAQEGRPLEEVLDQVAGQNEFARLVTAIESGYPQQLSAARWDPTPASRGEIAFVEMPADGALDLIRAFGLGVTVRVVGGTSGQDAVAAQVRAFGAAHGVSGVRQASSSVDPTTATIRLQISPDPALTPDEVDRLVADVTRVAEAAAADPALDLVVTVEPLGTGG